MSGHAPAHRCTVSWRELRVIWFARVRVCIHAYKLFCGVLISPNLYFFYIYKLRDLYFPSSSYLLPVHCMPACHENSTWSWGRDASSTLGGKEKGKCSEVKRDVVLKDPSPSMIGIRKKSGKLLDLFHPGPCCTTWPDRVDGRKV